jgi:hypothetical protein
MPKSSNPPETKTAANPETAAAEKPADKKPAVNVGDLEPLTEEQQQLLTRCVQKFAAKNRITSAAAVERIVREPVVLDDIASDVQADILKLGDLLKPFPDAAILREVNDRRV